jgi:tetratricopeptide (TPR) repeat protein
VKRRVFFILVILILIVAVGFGVYAWWVRQPSQLPQPGDEHGSCVQYGITFDDSALQMQFNQTEAVLGDPAAFWAQDRAHSLVATSPRLNPDSLPPEEWLQEMEALMKLSPEARLEQEPYLAAQEIMDYRESYCALGIPIIRSLLPSTADLETTVHFTAFTDPSAFTADFDVVMNIDMTRYFGKSAYLLNTLSHELFHIGYWRYQPHQREIWPQSYSLKAALVTLQNEGMATYSQEPINAYYPAWLERDLLVSQSELFVRFLIGRVNTFLTQAQSMPEDEVIRIVYSGLNQQALYSVGAHMARTIDQELGREALAETVAQGPRTFIRTYNRLVSEDWRIVEIPVSQTLNPAQQLRQAAIKRRYDEIPDLLSEIRSMTAERLDGAIFEEIRSAGYVFLDHQEVDLGVSVFEVMVAVFPEHPYSHIYLAKAYQVQGQHALAEDCYKVALELDPTLMALTDFTKGSGR